MKPSVDQWLKEAKESENADKIGMILVHNGVVRKTAKAKVRQGMDCPDVTGMAFSYDAVLAEKVRKETLKMPGIYYARFWLNEGMLSVGDDIMMVLVGGDIRPHVIDALQYLVGRLKSECVKEKEV